MNSLDFITYEPAGFELRELKPTYFEFGGSGDWFVRLMNDGRVEINENYTMEEAAQKFWECVINAYPGFFDKNPSEFERLCGKDR